MADETFTEHLSRIQTCWSQVCKAHEGPTIARRSAQQELLDRYGGAVRRYLLGGLRDPDAADELFQEFAIGLLKGTLQGADPERGKFRNYLRGVLSHLMADHYRKAQRRPRQLSSDFNEPAAKPATLEQIDQEFLASWRDELLARAWSRLEQHEKEHDQPFYTVLRFRADNPKLKSQDLAHELSERLGKPVTAAGTRQLIHRARERFAELLLEDVAHSLSVPSRARLEQELMELGLLEYCKAVLDQRDRDT
jgi:RNA polymerase sigma factor (sigma-70 family)